VLDILQLVIWLLMVVAGLVVVSIATGCTSPHVHNMQRPWNPDYPATWVRGDMPLRVWSDSKALSPALDAAIDIINGQTCRLFVRTEIPHTAEVIVRPGIDDSKFHRKGMAGWATLDRNRALINVRMQFTDWKMAELLTHELGHVLGLEDENLIGDSVMAAAVTPRIRSIKFSTLERAALRARYCAD
jgi:hypothetical protein